MVEINKTVNRIFIVLILTGLITYKYLSLRHHTISDCAIIVLGGGVNPSTDNDHVPMHTQKRLDKAVYLYHQIEGKCSIITTSYGTTYKPNPLDGDGFVITEATASAKKLVKMGIPCKDVFEENVSLDTIGNAYFVRTIHVEPGQIKNLFVVSNAWHIERVQSIFNFVFALEPAMNTKLNFVSTGNGIEVVDILNSRIEKEKKSHEQFQHFVHTKSKDITSMNDMRQWLFQKHKAYSSSRFSNSNDRTAGLTEAALKTY